MWRHLAKYFNAYPKRKILAQKLLEYGLKVNKNKIYCGEIELSDAKIARAFNIDRRIIADTIKTINKVKDLQKVFYLLKPTCHLKDVAPEMDWGVIEIIPEDPRMPGILSNVASVVSDANIVIRQAIVDDFELSEEPRLFIVVEKQLPGKLIPNIKKIKGVKAVVIY
jgi:predicted regulator of amino acid metabolism with ACT domain